jgi:hypothetical protein
MKPLDLPLINLSESAQVLEKNHFLPGQNRSTVAAMAYPNAPQPQVWLLLMAACLVLATLAPVAILAG